MIVVAVIVVALAVFGAVLYISHVGQERRRARMRAVAAAAGLEVDTSNKRPPQLSFDLFDEGHSRNVTAQMWRAGDHDSVFQYRYTIGSGKHRRTVEHTAALVQIPFQAPHLTIAAENWWSMAKRVVGLRDIEIESPAFNSRYHVRCSDERFAIALLDPAMISWMLSSSSGHGAVTFEFGGRWMLCHCDQLELEQLPPFLEWAQSARTQLPTVLSDLYRP